MSYTKFEYLSAVTDKNSYDFDKDTCINVTVKVKNTGDRDGKEVVQVYVRDAVSSIVMPVKELKAFKKIFIRAGNSEEITLEIPLSELRLTDNDGKFSVTVQSDDTLLFKYKDNDATEVKIEGRRSIAVKLL